MEFVDICETLPLKCFYNYYVIYLSVVLNLCVCTYRYPKNKYTELKGEYYGPD